MAHIDPQKILLAWSGTKDSTLALHALQADTRYEVVGLLTAVAEDYSQVSHCGERGEYHTFVYAGPLFKQPLAMTLGEHASWSGHHFIDLLPAPPPTSKPRMPRLVTEAAPRDAVGG